MKRHPELLRTPTSTSAARALHFNKPQYDRYFENLAKSFDTYKFPRQAIYNMDETGISTVPNKPSKEISTKEKRCVKKSKELNMVNQHNTRKCGQCFWTFYSMSINISSQVFEGRTFGRWGALLSCMGIGSDTSDVNSSLFLDWLSHFKDHAKLCKDNPMLFILDKYNTLHLKGS